MTGWRGDTDNTGVSRGWLGLVALLSLLMETACASRQAPPPDTYRYTCCPAEVSTRTWHPGERLTLRWTAIPLGTAHGSGPTQVTLTAEVLGPFIPSEVHGTGFKLDLPLVASAAPLRIDSRTATGLVSEIMAPETMPAGCYYHLQTRAAYGPSGPPDDRFFLPIRVEPAPGRSTADPRCAYPARP